MVPIKIRIVGLAALGVWGLSGCGFHAASPPLATVLPREPVHHTVLVPKVQWYPVSVGNSVLLAEGAQISSVLQGRHGRVYYGTTNPWGDANVLGWLNPATLANQWTSVPAVNPPFPVNAGLNNLSPQESATWGGVSLVVSGPHNIWYRTWGYVGGWSQTTGKFIPGRYTVPGPTVTNGPWTASISSNFEGQSHLTIMSVANSHAVRVPVPSGSQPVSLVITGPHQGLAPTVWLETTQQILKLLPGRHAWLPVATLPSNDFFVALGRWGTTLWSVDADGTVSRIGHRRLEKVARLPLSPLNAVAAPEGGLWIVTPHRVALYEPHRPLKTWPEPSNPYTAPASKWATRGANEPPNWPPSAHLSAGTQDSAIIGEGTWVGIGKLVRKTVTTTKGG